MLLSHPPTYAINHFVSTPCYRARNGKDNATSNQVANQDQH
jgi:hypothetical protein